MARVVDTAVFDLGGVLFDWDPEYVYRDLIPDTDERRRFLAEICTREWHERHDAGVSFAENAAPLLRRYQGDARMQNLITAWGQRHTDMIRAEIKGTADIIKTLDKAGVSLFALSNWNAETFPQARARYASLAHFRDIVVSGVEKVKKPDPAIYRILLERTGIDPARAVYIDDRAENLAPAKALGFAVIQFTDPAALAAGLNHLGLAV